MGFVVPPDAYTRFMGRYAEPLAEMFVAFSGVGVGDKVLDVGCGPGALTAQLLSVGANVTAIDPSPPFIDAIRARFPDVDARQGTAEELPYDTADFRRIPGAIGRALHVGSGGRCEADGAGDSA